MKLYNFWILTLVSFWLTISGCSKDKTEKPESVTTSVAHFLWAEKNKTEEAKIEILNQFNEPVAGAKVLIGNDLNTPFKDNLITTNELGIANIPIDWKSPASVTVDSKGYIRQTLLNVNPGNLTIRLKMSYLAEGAEVRGLVSQLPVIDGDKLIDFSLVVPTFSKSDLYALDMNQIISPYEDVITVAGNQKTISSNITLPKQKETYMIGITLNKPTYRVKVPTLGQKKFLAARGRFPFKTVASEINDGKQFYEMINYFSFIGGGIRETTILDPVTNLDIPSNEIPFNTTVNVNPIEVQPDELLLVLATSDISNSLIMTDIKRATNKQPIALQSIQNTPVTIINILKKQSEFMSQEPGGDRMSTSLLPYSSNNLTQKLLPLISNPSIIFSTHYSVNLPNPPNTIGIHPLAVSVTISDLVDVHDTVKNLKMPIKKWEVLGLGWNQQINLPKWPLDKPSSHQRVEVKYFGSITTRNAEYNDSLITNTTHISHASADF